MSCTLGQASDHPSSFLCPLLSFFTLSSFQRTVATNLAKNHQDSRVVLAWRARRSDDAARDGRRQDGSGRLRTERSFRRWTQTRASKPNRELCTACTPGAEGRKRQRLTPKMCKNRCGVSATRVVRAPVKNALERTNLQTGKIPPQRDMSGEDKLG